MQRVLPAVLALALGVAPASGGEVADKAAEAEALAQDGKFIEAIDLLDQAADTLWDMAPLGFRIALWVTASPGGFGFYTPRETSIYASGEPMIAYIEPVGFGWQKAGDFWRMDLAADVTIKTKEGAEVFSQNDFEKTSVSSRVRSRGFYVHFTFTMTGIPAGEYVLSTTLRDGVNGKRGTFALPFVIAEGKGGN